MNLSTSAQTLRKPLLATKDLLIECVEIDQQYRDAICLAHQGFEYRLR